MTNLHQLTLQSTTSCPNNMDIVCVTTDYCDVTSPYLLQNSWNVKLMSLLQTTIASFFP